MQRRRLTWYASRGGRGTELYWTSRIVCSGPDLVAIVAVSRSRKDRLTHARRVRTRRVCVRMCV